MARIELEDAQAWAEKTKLPFSGLDAALLSQVESHIITKLRSCGVDSDAIDTWADSATTPAFVKSIMAMWYVAWYYDRQYSEDSSEGNAYAQMLRRHAEMLLTNICEGTIEIDGVDSNAGKPAFFPTDASSALEPTELNPELGGSYFQMSRGF